MLRQALTEVLRLALNSCVVQKALNDPSDPVPASWDGPALRKFLCNTFLCLKKFCVIYRNTISYTAVFYQVVGEERLMIYIEEGN